METVEFQRTTEDKPVSSLNKFHKIFTTNFNLNFGHPRRDVCSFCTELGVKIKIEDNKDMKIQLKTELNTHKIRSKIFSKMMLTRSLLMTPIGVI
jgi:hypothetical protein